MESTQVVFKKMKTSEIEAYIATGEGADKAGSYGIQGLGSFFVKRIDGNYENVVGLPVCPLIDAFIELGVIPVFPLVSDFF